MVLQLSPPPDIAPRLGEHGGSTAANSHIQAHTSSESSEFVCMANAPLPVRGSRVQCAGDCTSGIRFGRAAPPHWFGLGLVLCSSACAAHAGAYQMLGRCAPLTGLGIVVLPAASVCGTRVCSRVCVYVQVPGRIWQVCKGSVCVRVLCVCGFPARVLLEGSALP